MGELDLNLLLHDYGPWFLVGVMVLRELLPFLRDKLFPQVLNERKEESEHRRALSERQVKAHEEIAKSVQQTAVLLATLDARSEVIANGLQRIEVIVTEINVRSRQDQEAIPVVPPKRVRR